MRGAKVDNKAVADIQITAEQLMREAWERQDEAPPPAPTQKIMDEGELHDYQRRQRTMFENQLRIKKHTAGMCIDQAGGAVADSFRIKYARWEEKQNEIKRARSVFERALDLDYKNPKVWSVYFDMEIRHRNVNHARNLADRAVGLLPRVHAFWFKYILMESRLKNYAAVRRLYGRWIEWEPSPQAWNSYIKFEIQAGEIENARQVFKKYVMVHRTPKTWLKWAKFEERENELGNAREIYEKALEVLEDEQESHAELYIAFALMEERAREYERARAIYKYALDRISKADAKELFTKFIQFEKQFGDKDAIEYIILSKRRFQYEEMLAEDSTNYDVWFDYIRLEENTGEVAKIREIFERAIASDNIPPVAEKTYWSRYIYLWINYALFEEISAKDITRARQIYQTLLKVIPHDKFSFNKVWTMFATFEIRQKNLTAARKILGHAIGMAPTDKIFDFYIDLEMQLGHIDRCRELFQKWLQWRPDNCKGWVKFSELEAELEDEDRVRGILEIAVNQPELDMPELVWKAIRYIDYEVQLGEAANARNLYKRLLERTKHVKVWISYAQFEAEAGRIPAARSVYKQAFQYLKPVEHTEERVILIEAWRDFEEMHGSQEDQEVIMKNMPARVKKRRKIETNDGSNVGYEEFYDYVFPDMKQMRAGMKLLQAAKKWKASQAQ